MPLLLITHLQERLDLGPLLNLLLRHLLGDLPWVPVNASYQGVAGGGNKFQIGHNEPMSKI